MLVLIDPPAPLGSSDVCRQPARETRLRQEKGVSGRIDLEARLWTYADGLHRRHNTGRPSITP